MSIREFCVLMLVCGLWGLHFVVIKFTVAEMGVPPLFYAALRVSLLALILLPFLKWHRGQMKAVILGGLGFGALNYAFMFFIGVVLIGLGAPSEVAGPGFILGIAMVACGAMAEAVGAISVKSVKSVSPVQLLVWFGIVGACVLWPTRLPRLD